MLINGLGWSLGGLLSLEVASVLAQTCPSIQVLGIVMIDSIYPLVIPASTAARSIVPSEPIFGISTKEEMRARVSHCMNLAFEMIKTWVPPVWKGCEDKQVYERRVRIEQEWIWRLGGQAARNSPGMENLPPPPRTVLLKCSEYVPTKSDIPNAIARVDAVREREKLGWEDYPYDFLSAVLEIPGHHFNIFTNPYVSSPRTTSMAILTDCSSTTSPRELNSPAGCWNALTCDRLPCSVEADISKAFDYRSKFS